MIVGYTFKADTLCPAEIEKDFGGGSTDDAETILDRVAVERGIDRYDERSFDSGDFPKVIFSSMVESPDERCGECGKSLIP